jgi:capsular exopolysaccharide synthesis family protein
MPDENSELEKIPRQVIDIAARETSEVRPHYPNSYGYGYGNATDDQKIHLRELWRTVRKRKWLIATIAVIITTLVTIDMYRTKDTFQASCLIEIGKDMTTLGRPGSIYGDDYDPFYMVNIKTKMLMVKSHSLLEVVVTEKHLDQNPKFYRAGGKKTFWQALRVLGTKVGIENNERSEAADTQAEMVVSGDSEETEEEKTKKRIESCIGLLEGGLGVEPVKETRALRISFTHTDPKIAAEITNAVANTFLDRNFENKTEKFRGAAKWLDESTRKLKSKVEEADQALKNYEREHGIFATDKDGTLTTAKLSSLHAQVLRAQTDRMLKQSLYAEVKEGRVEKLPEAYADLLFKTAPKVADLQRQLSDLQTQLAELNVKFGPENLKVVETQEKIASIKNQIAESGKSLEEKLKNEYDRAVREETMLSAALASAKGEAIRQNQDAIQYNLLKGDVDTNKALYQDFLNKSNQAQAQVVEQQNNLRVIEPAQVPGWPVGPRRMFTILIGLLLSTAAGVGLAFLLDYLDNTIKTVEDVSRYAQLPALSVVPAVVGGARRGLAAKGRKVLGNGQSRPAQSEASYQLATLDNQSSAAEAYRVLRTSVLLSAAGRPPKTILITSGQPGEGKTTTVVNTAISLAQMGASVLIIDCDLRRPTTHKVLGVNHPQGLSTYLSREVPLAELIQKLPIANLSLLPCGPVPPNPAELIISEKMKDMLRDLATQYDHILIDSPPLINVTDPVILSTMVDGVILVVHGGKSTRDVVRRARQELSTVGAKIFGVVLNNVDLRRDGYDNYYYYRYYSGYGQENSKGQNVEMRQQ